MAPGPHQPLHGHPSRTFVQQVLHRLEVCNRVYDVGQQLHFVSLLGHQPTRVHVVGGPVFKHLISAIALHGLSSGGDGLTKGNFQIVELPRDHHRGKEVRHHPDRLQLLHQIDFFRRDVEASSCSDLGVAEDRHNRAEVIGSHANVAVSDHEDVVCGFVRQPVKPAHFVVDCVAAGAEKQPNLAVRELLDQLFQQRQRGVAGVNTEDDLILRIILAAEACVVFVRILVEALDWFQAADRGEEIGIRGRVPLGLSEKPRGAVHRQEIVNKRDRGDGENDILNDGENLHTSSVASALISLWREGTKVISASSPYTRRDKPFRFGIFGMREAAAAFRAKF